MTYVYDQFVDLALTRAPRPAQNVSFGQPIHSLGSVPSSSINFLGSGLPSLPGYTAGSSSPPLSAAQPLCALLVLNCGWHSPSWLHGEGSEQTTANLHGEADALDSLANDPLPFENENNLVLFLQQIICMVWVLGAVRAQDKHLKIKRLRVRHFGRP